MSDQGEEETDEEVVKVVEGKVDSRIGVGCGSSDDWTSVRRRRRVSGRKGVVATGVLWGNLVFIIILCIDSVTF